MRKLLLIGRAEYLALTRGSSFDGCKKKDPRECPANFLVSARNGFCSGPPSHLSGYSVIDVAPVQQIQGGRDKGNLSACSSRLQYLWSESYKKPMKQ